MITLGATATDRITNFTGIVTGRANYLTGCDQYLVSPRTPDKDPKWFDEQRLVVDETFEVVVLDNSNGNGADIAAPIK
ncbi:MAG TPA: hypothetical protein VK181_04475 [Rhizobium sp.]|nr:hypothetical protein [Rhizobium sp.]